MHGKIVIEFKTPSFLLFIYWGAIVRHHTFFTKCWFWRACSAFSPRCPAMRWVDSPRLDASLQLGAPLSWEMNVGRTISRLDHDTIPGLFLSPEACLGSPANDFWRETDTCLIFEYFLPCRISFPPKFFFYSCIWSLWSFYLYKWPVAPWAGVLHALEPVRVIRHSPMMAKLKVEKKVEMSYLS